MSLIVLQQSSGSSITVPFNDTQNLLNQGLFLRLFQGLLTAVVIMFRLQSWCSVFERHSQQRVSTDLIYLQCCLIMYYLAISGKIVHALRAFCHLLVGEDLAKLYVV